MKVRVSHLHMKRLRAVRFLKKMRITKPYIISSVNMDIQDQKTPVYPQVSASVQEVLENSVLTDKDAKTELDKSVERINAKLSVM